MNAVLYWLGIYLLGGLAFLASMHIKTRLKKIVKQSSSATKRREDAIVQLLIMLFWPLVVGMLVYEGLFNRPKPAQIYRTWIATPESLIETLTISSIEQQQIYSDPLNAVPPIPFGHLHDAWQRFCQTLQKNDQLWSFKIDTQEDEGLDYFSRGDIVEGYAVVRNGEISGEFFAHLKQCP